MNGKAMTYTYMCIKRHVKNRSPVHAVLQRAKQLDRTTIAATDKVGTRLTLFCCFKIMYTIGIPLCVIQCVPFR